MIGLIYLTCAFFWWVCVISFKLSCMVVYGVINLFLCLCGVIGGCAFGVHNNKVVITPKHIEEETNNTEEETNNTEDIWIYTELEAYQKQIRANLEIIDECERKLRIGEYNGLIKREEKIKLYKKIADTEAHIAGLEKKIRKIGQKYNIEVESYLE